MTHNYLLLGAKKRLIEELRQKGITDENVLQAFDKVERHRFVESFLWDRAYDNVALKLLNGQTISHPFTVAFQSQLLQVSKGMTVLEIGTGSGFQAAILSAMGARVFSVERQQVLYQRTSKLLAELDHRIVTWYGDGFKGNSLMYIPTAEEVPQMSWATAGDAAKFENYIRNDLYLRSHRGQWSERYAGIAPFEHHFDLHVGQDFIFDRNRGTKLQLFADVMNLGNLINREWGANWGSAYNLRVLKVTGVTNDAAGNAVPTYQYAPYTLSLSDFYSRWRCQVGARITF